MKRPTTRLLVALAFLFTHTVIAAETDTMTSPGSSLEGTWTLAFADVKHPDGQRAHDFGPSPTGVLHIDHEGRYALFIFDSTRPRFAANDRTAGTAAEFKAAILGTSAHFGTLTVDPTKHTLTFHIQGSTFPNWEGTVQIRHYVLEGGVLSYEVPPRANGDIPLTGWKKVSP